MQTRLPGPQAPSVFVQSGITQHWLVVTFAAGALVGAGFVVGAVAGWSFARLCARSVECV